jgi:hypothetical protein
MSGGKILMKLKKSKIFDFAKKLVKKYLSGSNNSLSLRDLVDVNISQIGDNAIVSIVEKERKKERKKESVNFKAKLFIIKVMYNGKSEIITSRKKSTQVKLSDFGRYSFFIGTSNIKLGYIRKCLWYYSDTQKNDYSNFINQKNKSNTERLPLAQLRYPYQNLAVIIPKNKDQNSEKKCKELESSENMKLYNVDSLYILSQIEPLKMNDCTLFFSGKTKYDNKFILGQNDIKKDFDSSILLNDIGYFSAIRIKNKNLEITNDYFGVCPLYYYNGNEISVISSSYHLLVLSLKKFGITLELDTSHVIPYFVSGERQQFEQLSSEYTFIKGIKKLPIHSKVNADKSGIIFKDKEIVSFMTNKITYDEAKYQHLIAEYAEDIKKNLKLVIDDERFKEIIVDVSGGKDSRVILSVLLDLKTENIKKVKISSLNPPSKKGDKESFIPLNHLHNFEYDDFPDTLKLADQKERLKQRRSVYMGTLFSYPIPWKYERTSQNASKMNITGAGGEVFLVECNSLQNPNIKYDDIETITDTYALNYNNCWIDWDKISPYIKNLIKESIENVKGRSPRDKFNNYYLYYRNCYHFGMEVLFSWMESSKEQWFPLYSKKGFELRQLITNKIGAIKLSVDLINYCAPQLLKVPFSNKKYNDELKLLFKKNPQYYKNALNKNVKINTEETDWIQANKRKSENRKIINSKEEQFTSSQNEKEIINSLYDDVFIKLHEILQFDKEIEKVIGLDLYQKLKTFKKESWPNRDFIFMYNKIITVCDLISLIND